MKNRLLAIVAMLYMGGMLLALSSHGISETILKVTATSLLALTVWIFSWLPKKFKLSFTIGILLCMIGDGTLAYQKYVTGELQSTLFMIGLASFLLGYLTYSGTIFVMKKSLIQSPVVMAVLIVTASISLWQYSQFTMVPAELKVPVMLYLIQATLLVAAGALAFITFPGMTKWAFLVGTIVIYVSDSFIGWNLFQSPLPQNGEVPILVTYTIGQVALGWSLTTSEDII